MKKISSPAELTAAAATAGIALENLRSQLAQAAGRVLKLSSRPDGTDGANVCNPAGVWVRDLVAPPHEVGESWCAIISAVDGKTYEQDFTIEAGAIKLTGEPREVIQNVEYTPVPAAAVEAGDVNGGQGGTGGTAGTAQPRKGDGKFHGAAAATKEAFAASELAKTKPEHEAAAKLHDAAAELQTAAGNLDQAKVHKEKSIFHRDHAVALTASAPEARSQKPEVRIMALEAEALTQLETPDVFAGFMAMAGGIQTMTLGCYGKPVTVTINVNPAGARALQAQLETINRSTQQKAFNCFFHEKKSASSWPTKFFWQDAKNGKPPGIYEAAEPSEDGLKAVKGKTCRGFSLTFFTNADPQPLPLDAGWIIPAGAPGSPENPAVIICPDDVAENPTHYLNMGTLTNRPASVHNQPLFAGDVPAGKNSPTPVVPARQAGAQPSSINTKNKMETKPLDAEALQARNVQLEQKIVELEAQDNAVAKAQLEAAQAELRENNTKLELAKSQAKIVAFEAEQLKAVKATATQAVHDMIESQQIPALDKELQASWQGKFEADPSLIPLIVKKGAAAGARRFTPGGTAVEMQASRAGSSVEFGFSVPAEMKQLLTLVNRNAAIRIAPGMSKAMMEAAYEEKGKLALQAGLLYKKTLDPHYADWRDIPPSELAKCVGLEFNAASMFNRRAFEAADYTDPNNQFQTLNGTLVLQRTLPLFALDYPELGSMFTDFSDAPGLYQQTEMTRVVNIPAVQLYNAGLDVNGRPIGFVVASPASTVDASLTLSAYIAVPIVIGQATLSTTQRRLIDEIAPAGLKAISGYFTGMITALLTPGNFNAYTQVTAPDANGVQLVPVAYANYAKSLQDFDVTDFDKLDAILTQNKVPSQDRGILLNPQYFAKARNAARLLFAYAASEDSPQLTESQLPSKISGFKPFKAAYLPANVPFFPFHKAAVMLKSRLPMDFTQAVGAMVPGSITTVTEPDTKFSVALVQRVDLTGNYAEWRPEVQLGAAVGDKRGALCGAAQ